MKIDNIIVDMDRTLLKTNIGKEALVLCYGQKKADEIEHSVMKKVANGIISIGEAMVMGNNYLVKGDFTNKKYQLLLDKCIKGEFIRQDLLNSIIKLHERGKRIILATMSTQTTATWFAEKYGFFGAIGTIENYNNDGKMTGCSQIICEDNKEINGVKFRTKTYLLKEIFNKHNIVFDPKKTAIITDDITDLHLMRELAMGILLKLQEPTNVQKLCYRLKLFDYSIKENEDLGKIIK